MLPKKNRLIETTDFNAVYKNGRYFSYGNLGIKVMRNNLKTNRFGISVGIKVSKKATTRNKIKRLLREIANAFVFEITPGFDIIMFYQKNGEEIASLEELVQQFKMILKKSNLPINKNK